MKLLNHLIAFIILAGMIVASPSAAMDTKSTVKVVYTEWFPYTFTEDGQPAGFEIEILRSVLENMGIEAEFTSYPWKRCLAHLKTGQAELLVSMLHSLEREAYTFYPEENISSSRTSFFVRADSPIIYNGDLDTMEKYSVGVVLGFTYGETFDNVEFAVKDQSSNAEQIINKVLAQRVDLGAENEAVVSAQANRLGVRDNIRFLSPPIHNQKLYVGFSKALKLKELSEKFSKSLADFKKTDRYMNIMLKYGVQHEAN